MAVTIKMNAVNQIPKGEKLFEEGEASDGIFAVLKGKAALVNSGVCLTATGGDFLGVWDLYAGNHDVSCVATEDLTVFALPANNVSDLRTIFHSNKEYGGRVAVSMGRYITELFSKMSLYLHGAKTLPDVVSELYRQYCGCCKSEGIRAADLPPDVKETVPVTEPPELAEYYLEAAKIPAEVQTAYFSCGTGVVMRHIEEQSVVIRRLIEECKKQGSFLRRQGAVLINAGADNMFYYLCALEEKAENPETKKAAVLLRDISEKKLCELAALFDKCGGEPFEAYEKRREARKQGQGFVTDSDEPCENSLEQILLYAGASQESAMRYTELVKEFAGLGDKASAEDEVRCLRKQLSDGFYPLYESVFKKAYGKENGELPLPVQLFLDFGFIDETLISRTQLLELEKLQLEPVSEAADVCHIFTMREWLSFVYEGKREPSKNEFDQEYAEMLRELRKSGRISEDEEKTKLKDSDERLHYEIQNLFRCNHRLVNGQLSIFVPFLYEDLLGGGAEHAFLSKRMVTEAADRLRSMDYSLFYREFMYINKELGIEKEYHMAEILPDIILFPTMGSKSILWQDISCRRRDTPGRFLLPQFTEVSLWDLMVRVCGRYRWELCRTMQGAMWNNIQVKSLTSEYTDYLMYYRKNRDISEERKEAVKLQLQKGKNNYREVFAMDYEVWIKNESSGAMKLNKVAREILATYCPFDVKIRAQLAQQPAFEEAMARQTRERAKKIRETELRNHALTKNGIEPPQELLDTLAYYREH